VVGDHAYLPLHSGRVSDRILDGGVQGEAMTDRELVAIMAAILTAGNLAARGGYIKPDEVVKAAMEILKSVELGPKHA